MKKGTRVPATGGPASLAMMQSTLVALRREQVAAESEKEADKRKRQR